MSLVAPRHVGSSRIGDETLSLALAGGFFYHLRHQGRPMRMFFNLMFNSVQFSHSIVSNSLQPHGQQHIRLPCPSSSPRVCSNSCPLSQWCHPTISASVIPLSSHLQSFPISGSFQMSQFFASGGQGIEVSASTSVLPVNIQDWFPLGWTGWIYLQTRGLSRIFSNTTVQKHQVFSAQLSSQSNSHIHTWPLETPQLWLHRPLSAKNLLLSMYQQ